MNRLAVVLCLVACTGPTPQPDAGSGGGSAAGGGTATGGGSSTGGGGSSTGGGSSGAGGGNAIADAGLSCDGGETFQAARTAMLSTCGGVTLNCHSISPYDGNLDLTAPDAYSSLVGVTATAAARLRVSPHDPLGSFLVQKLTNTQGPTEGGPMPQEEGIPWHSPDPESLRVLECWIQQGATNN